MKPLTIAQIAEFRGRIITSEINEKREKRTIRFEPSPRKKVEDKLEQMARERDLLEVWE